MALRAVLVAGRFAGQGIGPARFVVTAGLEERLAEVIGGADRYRRRCGIDITGQD